MTPSRYLVAEVLPKLGWASILNTYVPWSMQRVIKWLINHAVSSNCTIRRVSDSKSLTSPRATNIIPSVLGGTEDVLGDLGVRQAIRNMPKDVRL